MVIPCNIYTCDKSYFVIFITNRRASAPAFCKTPIRRPDFPDWNRAPRVRDSVMAADSGKKLFVGPRFRRIRQQLGLSQTQIAEGLGISPSYINMIERNQRPVTR